jgi:hypothetical protein
MAEGSDCVVAADSSEPVLIIERIFDAPRDLVFKCWTDPEHFARWIGPQGFTSAILAGNYILAASISSTSADPTVRSTGSRVFSRKSFRPRESCGRIAGWTIMGSQRVLRPY